MRWIIEVIVSKLKGEKYKLDDNIPILYLFSMISTRLIMYIRGFLTFKRLCSSFIGANTVIKCKRNIKFRPGISIDRNCYIDALSKNGIVLGKNFSLGKNSSIECTGSIKNLGIGFVAGDNVGIGSYSFIGSAGGILIDNDTIIGNYVSFHSENHNFDDKNLPIRFQGVTRKGIKIGKGCWIGAKVTILDGAIIGDGCVVAAGSVVVGKEFDSYSVIGGVPAKIIKDR